MHKTHLGEGEGGGNGGGVVVVAKTKAWEATVRKSQVASTKLRTITKMSVTPTNDNEEEETYHAEKLLSNGDFYTGQWSTNDPLPHGHGKYLWTDGCMYVGEWRNGKKLGKGKFSWPSGATYEGDFKDGFMDGKGTYTGSYGDTYRGSWLMNLKNGQGTKSYANGDYYEGEWRRGLQNGHGRYQWKKSGNHYIGQWRNGVMHGNGTMIWSDSGNRYDGYWALGFPKGNGTFRWADGSFYVGVWSRDGEEQTGTYYPSGNSGDDPDSARMDEWEQNRVFNVDLRDCKVSQGETISIFPSQKVLGLLLQGHDDDGGRRISSYSSGYDLGPVGNIHYQEEDSSDSDSTRSNVRQVQPHVRIHQATKRQGVTIKKGHKNYELMLNLQLGIRHSVGRPAPATSLDLKASAFDPKEKVWTKFPPEGSKNTPPHQSCDFRWKDYCPVVFRTLRKLFKVDPADYMISICGNDALRELSSPGKSGSFFYLTHDDHYMIKTMKKAEVKVFLRMLPAYYNHVRAFENTLVTKFFGLHCVKLTGPAQKKVRFVIMGNLFCSEYSIHRRFDLKGSSHGRTTDKPESEINATTTLKDLDLNYIFRLQRVRFQEFCRQVDRDCEFLEQERIMDYSLLVGLHFRQTDGRKTGTCTPTANGESYNSRVEDRFLSDPNRWASIKLGINMPVIAERTVRKDGEAQLVGEPTGEFYDIIIFFGIIDILQDYDISKKLEHAYKSFQYDPTSISAVDPKQYSKRFRDFIFSVFVEDA